MFHEIAYKAHKKLDLLDGVDEFLDQVTVLPPGEWGEWQKIDLSAMSDHYIII